jgi:hypothetical protein
MVTHANENCKSLFLKDKKPLTSIAMHGEEIAKSKGSTLGSSQGVKGRWRSYNPARLTIFALYAAMAACSMNKRSSFFTASARGL